MNTVVASRPSNFSDLEAEPKTTNPVEAIFREARFEVEEKARRQAEREAAERAAALARKLASSPPESAKEPAPERVRYSYD